MTRATKGAACRVLPDYRLFSALVPRLRRLVFMCFRAQSILSFICRIHAGCGFGRTASGCIDNAKALPASPSLPASSSPTPEYDI